MIGCGDIYMIGGVEYMGYVFMNYNIDFYFGFVKYMVKVLGMMGMIVELFGC